MDWRNDLKSLKKYSGKHNGGHPLITNGFCYGCMSNLTPQQLEEEFGYNQAIDDVIDHIQTSVIEPFEKEARKYWYHAGRYHLAECPFILSDIGVCNCPNINLKAKWTHA